ncbi:MAG: endonuclease/exonuclease/phosphatase family protein [Prevotella sp.]|nr:endonuclease/exonuclease/phosphatase family protein [Prevotella sp.]
MKKILTLLALVLMGATAVHAQKKFEAHAIGFYNLENLFDTCHDEGKNDYQYLPDGTNKWTGLKYSHKLKNMSRVLSEMGTDVVPYGCVAIGVSEVENARCLTDLCNQEPLKARNFQFVHIEGPDQRGVDCALLYNPKFFSVRDVKLVPYVYVLPEDSLRATRGFLTVSGTLSGEHVTIIVNHLPSRFAGSFYREEGGRQLRLVKDSIMREDPNVKVLIMGDMNDDPQDKSMSEALGAKRKVKDMQDDPQGLWNPWWDVLASGTGTLQYDGAWNLFDQIILSRSLLDPKSFDGNKINTKKLNCQDLKYFRHQIFRRDYLFQKEGKYKGNTLRTHAGGAWLDGYSDHLPTVVYLMKEQK